jgi:phytoene dehydrogenase-like protein
MNKKIAIIGAGVDVFEKLPQCSGRNNLLEKRDFKFDMGLSFVLMPYFLRKEKFVLCRSHSM